MNLLQAALNEIMIQRVYFRQNSINSPDPKITPFLDALDEFELQIMTDTTRNYATFVRTNLQSFWVLKRTLVGKDVQLFKDAYTTRLRKRLTAQYNRIVINIRFNAIVDELTQRVTRTFTEFSKGITFFDHEHHASCGTKNLATAQKFLKTKFGPDMGPAISRCYIERLIYDEIFQNELGHQDIQHKLELDEVSRHYDKYFPGTNLRVRIRFLPNLVPISVDIITDDTIEKYTKTLNVNGDYNDVVFCEKQELRGNRNSFDKFQTFAGEAPWN
jgi:hypothetical protein